MNTPEHLGGHLGKTHVDSGVLLYFHELGCHTIIDVGCGPGGQVRSAIDLGYDRVLGVDGDPSLVKKHWNDDAHFVLHDFQNESYVPEFKPDLIWSCEFVEHVKPEYVDNFLKTFDTSQRYVVFTHAKPIFKKGKRLTNKWHFNEQESDYWIEQMKRYGWVKNESMTLEAKRRSTMKRKFFKETGMVFERG